MSANKSLRIILFFSIAGLLFSGYLSYYELFVPTGCADAVISCGDKAITLASLPACVYGFFMYLLVFIFSLLGIKGKPQN